ncbi:MAG: hypothetical protein AAGD35_03030 [Actinomycetota bacterium]
MREKLAEATNTKSGHILDGESVAGSASPFEYLYLLGWSDDNIYQGLIGTFEAGHRVHTGDSRWEVLPTGNNKGDNEFPTKQEIDSELASAGNSWTKPWVGPANDNAKPWGWTISGIPTEARWMWHDSGNQPSGRSPLDFGFDHGEYLIFRLPVRYLSDKVQVIKAGCCTVTTIVECTPQRPTKLTIDPGSVKG